MTKRRVPNVVRGGAAIPLKGKTNYYYMTGRKHTNGGIDIGQNAKTGIEVEDGEVMHITDNEVKVFSAVPFLNGESPAQKVMRGENANKVFNEQEQFKKVNNIEDDGSRKKQMGGDDKKVNISKPNELSRDAIKNLSEDSFVDLYIDNSGNIHYGHMFEPDENYIAKHGLTYIPIDDRNSFFKSYSKSLDYIGGTTEQSRANFFNKMPNVSQFVDSIAPKYNITSELLRHRLSKEGFVDKAIKEYNNRSNKDEQQNFNNNILNDTIYNGFHQFGLDNGYEYLTKRKTGLKDDVEWYDVEAENEKGKTVKAATGKTVRDNIILQAAILEHLKDEMKSKGVPEEKLETWTNAAFNLGPYHKDLNDSTFIEKNYNFKKKRMGGKHNVNNKELGSGNRGFYSVTDRGKTKYYMIPSTGNSSARSAEVRTKKLLGGINDELLVIDAKQPIKLGIPKLNYRHTDNIVYGARVNKMANPAMKPYIAGTFEKPALNLPKTIAPISTTVVPQKSNAIKDWWTDNKSNIISDGIGLVSNIAGSFISHSMNKNMLNRLKPAPQPIARQAAKLKTQININPQLDKMRETVAAYERNIDNNTSSSNVALARKQNARLANILNTNELYGTKENIETELINKDRLNQQAIAEKNVTDYNKWSTDVANFRNTILEQKSNNDVSLVNNLNAGIQNMLTVRGKRNAENQTIAAMVLANPNLPIEMFFEQGLINRKLYNAYKKAYPKKSVEP